MVKQNYLNYENPMEIDPTEELNTSSQSDSKLYEANNNSKNSNAKHSFSETVTKRETKIKAGNKYKENESRDDCKDNLNRKCIEKTSGDSQLKCSTNKESNRDPIRAESMIRQTITKMEKHRTVIPGMASARSLTNLISADYGWTPKAVYSKVEKALKSAAENGIIKEMINKQNGQRSYTVPDSKVKKYIKNFYGTSGNSKTYLYNHFSDLMKDE